LISQLDEEMKKATETDRKKLLRRSTLLKNMLKNKVQPEWMFVTVLPVLPPALRPMVQLDGGDYDNDGDLDLLVAGGKIQLFRNETINNANWLETKVIGKDHVDAIGTRLILSNEEISLMREIQGGKGTTNQHSLVQHFGLGTSQAPFKLEVIFPSDEKKLLMINEINKIVVVEE